MKINLRHAWIALLLSVCAAFIFAGCSPDFDTPLSPSDNVAFVYTTDFSSSASYSTIDLDSFTAYNDLGAGTVHTDAACRYFNDKVYIVNEMGRDSIQVLDPDYNFVTTQEFSVRADSTDDSNPHDIVPCGNGHACVTRYGDDELWIVDLDTGDKLAEVDLSDYGYDGNVPCMHTMYYDEANSRVFVALQRLTSSFKVPTDGYSSVVVLDVSSADASDIAVEKEIKLSWDDSGTVNATNPISYFRYVSSSVWNPGDDHDHILIACVGHYATYYELDCGIVAIDLTDLDVEEGYVLSESSADGEINDFAVTDSGQLFAILSDDNYYTWLSEFQLTADTLGSSLTKSKIHENDSSFGYMTAIAWDSSTDVLYYGDRKATDPGVRLYDTANETELNNGEPVYVGLPPYGICLVKQE